MENTLPNFNIPFLSCGTHLVIEYRSLENVFLPQVSHFMYGATIEFDSQIFRQIFLKERAVFIFSFMKEEIILVDIFRCYSKTLFFQTFSKNIV